MKFQKGSAHIVIISILIIVILGLLGFVFWQNFIKKPTVASTTTVSKVTAKPATKTTATDLTLTQLGVEVPYDTTTDTYTAAINTDATDSYRIYSQKTTAACGDQADIGSITRYSSSADLPTPLITVTIGQYIYGLAPLLNTCAADTSTTAGEAAFNVQVSATTAFQKVFADLKTTD